MKTLRDNTRPWLASLGMALTLSLSGCGGGSGSSAETPTTPPPAAVVAASITTQPTSTTTATGTGVTFSVVAEGTAPLTYQWQRGGVAIPGATAATYNLTSPALSDSGTNFNVTVSNSAGTVTSNVALLTVVEVLSPPTIAAQPQSSGTLDGSPVTLVVGVSGTGPFTYQWRRGGSAIAGASSATYTSPALTLTDSGAVYSVVVSNGVGSVTSANATVTVNPVPVALNSQPTNAVVLAGQTVTFSAAATGSAPIAYQWRRNGTPISGATTAIYTTPATTIADSGALYSVVVSNAANSVTSNSAVLSVTVAAVAPSITSQPIGTSVLAGQSATFSVVATGTPAPSFQWQSSADSGATWANISGATATTYTTGTLVLSDNARRLRVVATNSSGSAASQAAVLGVTAPPSVLSGRAWTSGQPLESDDRSVLASTVGIDDAGNATSVFIKSNGARNVLYATRGVPGPAGTAVAWSAPVAIDTAALPATTSGFNVTTPVLTVAPNGNAVVTWGSTSACTTSTYVNNVATRCNFLVSTKYDVATNAWSTPQAVADTPRFAPDIQQVINSRGDFALFYPGWVRSGTSGYTTRVAVLWQVKGQTAIQAKVFDDAALNLQTLGMDKDSNLLVAGSANQNATTDVVVYRGTMSVGFGPQEILDQRAATATFQLAAVGVNGQAVVVWTQNNGTVDTRYAADIGTPAGAWSVKEMEPRSNGRAFASYALTVTDNGDTIYAEYSNGSCAPYFHRLSGGSWSALTRFPSEYRGCNWDTTFNRSGDAVQFSGSAWQTYDAASNTIVRANSTSTSSVYGTNGGSTGTSSFALSTNGMGVLTVAVPFDTLPTVAQPAGDGRSAVTNLWGLFLK